MRSPPVVAATVLAASILPLTALDGQTAAVRPAVAHGTFAIHLILHAVGEEQYELVANADGTRTLTTTLDYTDRTTRRTTTATLTTTADERPLKLEIKGGAPAAVTVNGASTSVEIRGVSRTMVTPSMSAAVIGASPFALQMMMMRAWHARGEPKQLPLVSLNEKAEPLEIARVGRDTVTVEGRRVTLDRYTVNNLMLGGEIPQRAGVRWRATRVRWT